MLKIIMYTGILSSSWVLIATIACIIISFLLAAIKAVAHLAFEYPKKYALYASMLLAALMIGGYVLYNPSILSELNGKIAESTVLRNIVFGIAILVYYIVILSVIQITKGIFREE